VRIIGFLTILGIKLSIFLIFYLYLEIKKQRKNMIKAVFWDFGGVIF
tara:strand:+ start:740 stop:880 length:141 start_codon:yes stop_codon:yes gene_type:complete